MGIFGVIGLIILLLKAYLVVFRQLDSSLWINDYFMLQPPTFLFLSSKVSFTNLDFQGTKCILCTGKYFCPRFIFTPYTLVFSGRI